MIKIPWFKVDDKLHDHRKVRRMVSRPVGLRAIGLWTLAGSWCADNLEDGFVPEEVARRWGKPKDWDELVDAELWEAATVDGEPGWRFLNWEEYQPTKADVERERAATAERQRAYREKRRKEKEQGA